MSEEKKSEPPGPPQSGKNGPAKKLPERPKEIGGPKGPEPTRYGDWEHNGRCTDF
jgi:hypothetical protein